jgi:hypothetical protein
VKVGDIDRPVWIGLVSMASVAVVSVALMAWLIFDGRVSGSYILIGLAFGGILASLLYYCCFLAIAAAQQRVRDQHEQSETNLFAPRVMTLTDRGVLVEYWNTTTLILWPGIIKLVVAERFLMLFDGPLSAHVVPTRAFAGETERQQFVDRCRDHLGPKASAWAPDKRSGITERLQ